MVDGINNIASQIFSKLNSQDSNGTDDKIEASIWNKFVSDKGGKEISNYIKKENAVKSIISYLTNMSKKLGCTVEELANQWLGKSVVNPTDIDISEEKTKHKANSVDVPGMVILELTEGSVTSDEDANKQQQDKLQQSIDNAMQLISDVANGKYKYTVSNDNKHTYASNQTCKTISLKDGRTINVILEKNSQGKYKLDTLDINYGSTNYNGNDDSIHVWGNGRPLVGNSDAGGHISEKDLQELVKVISGILGEDIET